MFCSKCGAKIEGGGQVCGSCGASATTKAVKKINKKLLVVIAGVLVVIAGLIVALPLMKKSEDTYYLSNVLTVYYEGSSPTHETEEFYREDGQVLKKIDIRSPNRADGISAQHLINNYTYDEDGKIVKLEIEEKLRGESISVELNYSMRNDDYVGRGKFYDPDGEVIGSMEIVYGKNKKLIEEKFYDDKGEIESSKLYDKNGRVLETIDMHFRQVYTYDDNGNKIKNEMYIDGMLKQYFEWTYDDNGNSIKVEFYRDGMLEEYSEYKYEDNKLVETVDYGIDSNRIMKKTGSRKLEERNGNSEKLIHYDENGDVSGYTIGEYDNYGNMLKSTAYNANDEITSKSENGWSKRTK